MDVQNLCQPPGGGSQPISDFSDKGNMGGRGLGKTYSDVSDYILINMQNCQNIDTL